MMQKAPLSSPDFENEKDLMAMHGGLVAGLDEAGRGPWAGPVVAAAVILDEERVPPGLNDSKKLTAKKRNALFQSIMEVADVGIGIADVQRIDRDNILNASLWAMRQAFFDLKHKACSALIDGNKAPSLDVPCRCVVKGDSRSLSIAAASIVAKVSRDRIMDELARAHPDYAWERNKGYGTPDHKAALDHFGVTIHHRTSFRPVRLTMGQKD